MRLHRMFGPLLGALASLASVETVMAQQPYYGAGPGMSSGSAAIDGSGGYYQVPGGGAYPSYYQPWPAVSPYEMDYGQTAVEDGLWQYDGSSAFSTPAQWRFKTEYVRTRVRGAKGYVGFEGARTYKQEVLPILRDAPYSLTQVADSFEGGNGFPGQNYFDPVRGGEIHQPDLNGMRFTLDALNPEGSGLELIGLFSDGDGGFDARDYVVNGHPLGNLVYVSERVKVQLANDDPAILNATPGNIPNVIPFVPVRQSSAGGGNNQQNNNANVQYNPTGGYQDISQALAITLRNLRGIPLDDGTVTVGPDGRFMGGASAVYDLNFKLHYDVQQYGFGMRWNTNPWYKTRSFRLTPNVGVRYFNLQEEFGFMGQHSGLIYDNLAVTAAVNPAVLLHSLPNGIDDNNDGLIDPAGLIEGGAQQGGGGGGAGTGRFIYPTDNTVYPITSWLRNKVQSDLIGPEVGVTYAWGGELMHIGGRTNVSVMANFERMNLAGDNIFVTTRPSNLNTPSTADPKPNDFASEVNSNHVSPMLEQSFFFDGPFLRYVPVVRRSSLAYNANVSLGYSFMVIGQVTRPDQSILWRGNPSQNLYPSINPNRSSWFSDSFNVGLSWTW